jgi:hypothetical protein
MQLYLSRNTTRSWDLTVIKKYFLAKKQQFDGALFFSGRYNNLLNVYDSM